jgi:ferrous iron transport protein B
MRTAGATEERSGKSCGSCPAHRASDLERLGIDVSGHDYVVALAGNPNTGKSTVFNLLTGLRQHTGNWPGKTVTRAEGAFRYGGKGYKVVDLPGTYSLLAASPDEEVARDFLLFGRPDVTLAVVDATRLERNLNLILQIFEITPRVVICLNLIDQARRQGLEVDDRRLARDLGVPVVPMAARYREGLEALLLSVNEVATGAVACRGYRFRGEPPELKHRVDTLVGQLECAFPGLPNARWVALRLLDGDERIMAAVRTGELRVLGAEHGGANGHPQPAGAGVQP